MQAFGIAICLLLLVSQAFGYTFVLKSGKKIQGALLYDEESTIRIVDTTGVPMSLKKNVVDWEAMILANPPEPEVADVPELPASPIVSVKTTSLPRDIPVRFFPEDLTEKDWRERLRKAERDYNRLKEECRNAGTGPSVRRNLETHYYKVNGTTVKVTGYWAHPDSVASARNICQKAIRAELALTETRKGFTKIKSGSPSGSAGASFSANRK